MVVGKTDEEDQPQKKSTGFSFGFGFDDDGDEIPQISFHRCNKIDLETQQSTGTEILAGLPTAHSW